MITVLTLQNSYEDKNPAENILVKSASMVIPFSTMFYMEHLNISLWNSLASRNLTIFSFNSWIFTLFLNDDEFVENPKEFLRSNISKMEALSLNSRVYFFVISNKTNDEAKLFEAYRIGDRTEELQIHEIGSYSDNGFQTLTKTFIWERRKDLKGYEFSVVALPNEPFLNFQNNVSIFSKL